MSAAVVHRFEFDGVRRFAAALGAAVGLTHARSLALASHLLWFDAAGAPNLGIGSLASWLEAIEGRRVHPTAKGRVVSERTSVAVLDGENGPTPLVLEQAAEIAVEKARESAIGLVRVVGTEPIASAAAVAAAIATGPTAGWVLGPNRSGSLALPSLGGPPLVLDSALAAAASDESGPSRNTGRRGPAAGKPSAAGRDAPGSPSPLLEGFWLATEILVPEGGWLVAAVSISALDSPAAFGERLAAIAGGPAPARGRLSPEALESGRNEVRRNGVAIDPAAWKSLVKWADRLSVDRPAPLG